MLRAAPKPIRIRDDAARAYVRGLRCLLADEDPCTCGPWFNVVTRRTVTQVCHVRSRGAGHGDVANLWPGCSTHHAEQHRLGLRTFERRHRAALGGQTLAQHARRIWEDYQVERGGEPGTSRKEVR